MTAADVQKLDCKHALRERRRFLERTAKRFLSYASHITSIRLFHNGHDKTLRAAQG